MIWGKFHGLGLLLLAGASLAAGDFVPPAEGPVAFRRDRIPLDAETMGGLSRQLVTLAEGLDRATAADRRGAAQMLALAAALDPGNARAREMMVDFQKESRPPAVDPGLLAASRAGVWECLGWLETKEAGEQGQALAACLADVAAISDPQHPRAGALRSAGERGAWKGWIPGPAAYETKPPVATVEPPAEEAAPAKSGILLAKAGVLTPLWKRSARTAAGLWTLATAPLEMSARTISAEDGEPQPFSLVVGNQSNNSVLAPLVPPLLKLLEKEHGSLPAGGRVTIFSPALGESLLSRKVQSISGAAAVLASSAITGREPEATIIGLIDESGAFKLPGGFWNQLRSLGPGNGGRLVLPADAATGYLPSLLALERPQVFFEYEVVLASNFKELLELSAKTPDGTFAKVSAQFREIRERGATQPLGQYVANPFIRRRLAEIVQEAPYHASARMLAVQGAGNRPIFVSRPVLASELRRAIEPMEWLAIRPAGTIEDSDIAQIGATYETCHSQVDRLLRYAEKSDRAWLERVQDLVTTIRVLDRAAKGRGDSYEVMDEVATAHTAFLRAYVAVAGDLAREAGEAATDPDR